MSTLPKLVHVFKTKKDDEHHLSEWQMTNKSWEFIFWDDPAIKSKMATYPKLLLLYKYFQPFPEYSKIICPLLACYVILKEYGGVFTTFSSFLIPHQSLNTLFPRPAIIYIAANSSLFSTNYYPTQCLAMEKEHPVWREKVFPFLNRKQTQLAAAVKPSPVPVIPVEYAKKSCAAAIEHAFLKVMHSYPVIEIQYHENILISMTGAENSDFRTRVKQAGLVALAVLIIVVVERIYFYNVQIFGAVNVLPGIGAVSTSTLAKKKKYKNK